MINKTKGEQIVIVASKNGVVSIIGFQIRDNVGELISGRQDDTLVGVTVNFG